MNLNDLFNLSTRSDDEEVNGLYMKNQQNIAFPWKLHHLLETVEREGCESIISWLPDRQSFKVHDQKAFVEQILPRYFKVTKYKSFLRQLNIYGFERITDTSPRRGGYSHTYFVRGEPKLCVNMKRHKIKGNGKARRIKAPSSPLPSPSEQPSSILNQEEHQQEATKNVLVEEDSSIMAQEKRIPNKVQNSYHLHDADALMFHGKQFHFVDFDSSLEVQEQEQQQEMLPGKNIALAPPPFSKTSLQCKFKAFLTTMMDTDFEASDMHSTITNAESMTRQYPYRRASLIFSF